MNTPAGQVVKTLPRLLPRPIDSHKAHFGRVLIVAGSRGMSGAAVLCGSAALRAGAGLVKVATPGEIQPIVAAGNPCYTTAALPGDHEGKIALSAQSLLAELREQHDVVALGPGVGRSFPLTALVLRLVKRCTTPLVVDADGLNALIGQGHYLKHAAGPRILTPHPGEFARLLQSDPKSVHSRRSELAVEFAQAHGCIVVLKGAGTVVTDGQRVYVNTTGNPGMASGGTGDVLTGVIAAFLGQGLGAFEAAQLGVHVHGLAGDLACEQVGEVSLIATDLLDFLPAAIRQAMGSPV